MYKKIIILALVIAAIAAFFSFGGLEYININTLKEHRLFLQNMVDSHLLWIALLFIVLYALTTALMLPVGTILTLSGGFLFGAVQGTIFVVIGATIGASLLYFLVIFFLEGRLRQKVDSYIAPMQKGFAENALFYMLFLRFMPLFPFFIVNIVAALLRVKPIIFSGGTFIGIIPGTFVYALSGAGLSDILALGGAFSPKDIITPQILGAFAGLSLLAILPIIYKKLRKK